jgi:hypothetical protein
MRIFLDDERETPPGWQRVFTVRELISVFEKEYLKVGEISLDNDLGVGFEEGWKFLQWLEEKVFENPSYHVPNFRFHTANPEARRHMVAIYRSILRKKGEADA